MKWLDYDNAPETDARICNIPGCNVKHANLQHKRLHTA